MRLDAAVRYCAGVLQEARLSEAPQPEARRLVVRALGIAPEALVVRPDTVLSEAQVEQITLWLERRVGGEPLGRIAGIREFYGRPFALSPGTLEPRPDSETLIDATRELVGGRMAERSALRILDVGTGSGCLLLTLLAEFPEAVGVGTDISADALETAAENARGLGLADRVSWRRTSVIDGVEGVFDIVISNPPYIPTEEIDGLDPEVRLFDPMAALDGGPDGLAVYRLIAASIRRVLSPDGFVVLEVAAGHHAGVIDVFAAEWGEDATDCLGRWRDLGGHIRCVAVQSRPV